MLTFIFPLKSHILIYAGQYSSLYSSSSVPPPYPHQITAGQYSWRQKENSDYAMLGCGEWHELHFEFKHCQLNL